MASTRPTRHLEIETKLEIGPDVALDGLADDGRLRAAGLATVSDPVVYELDATYWDTDALQLLGAKLTLRRRTGGTDAGWHLKLPALAGARAEIGVPLEDSPSDEVPAALAYLIAGASRGLTLRPVARVRNHRTVRRLADVRGTELVEVADDRVTATAIDPSGAESPPATWRELEAELLAGDRDHLAATVGALTKRGATPASSASKLARALAETGALPEPVAVRKPRSAGAAVLGALRALVAALISSDLALREDTPTSLHEARATARRIRSVLAVYRDLFDQAVVEELREPFGEFSRVLGVARDLQVTHERLEPQLLEEPAEYASAARTRLDQVFADRESAARAEVLAALADPAYPAMLLRLDEFIAAPPRSARADRSATDELPLLIGRAWKRLRLLADAALADPDNLEAVHLVRRRAKSLRYAVEASIGVLGEPAVLFAAAVEEIQEVLGEFQDATVCAALLAELALDPGTDGTAGFVFGRLHAFEQATAHGCLDDFTDAWQRVQDGAVLP